MKESLDLVRKNPISPVLQGLDMYETVEFPLKRAGVVRATTQLLKNSHNLKFSTKKNNETSMLKVTRIA